MEFDAQTIIAVVTAVAGSSVLQESIHAYRNYRKEAAAAAAAPADRERASFEKRIASLEAQVSGLQTKLDQTLGLYFAEATRAARAEAEVEYLRTLLKISRDKDNQNAELSRTIDQPQVHPRSGDGTGPTGQLPPAQPPQ